MTTEMAEVSNRVNFGSWVGRLTCPEKSGQREYPMISGLVRKKRYGIQCPENIGPASTWLSTQTRPEAPGAKRLSEVLLFCNDRQRQQTDWHTVKEDFDTDIHTQVAAFWQINKWIHADTQTWQIHNNQDNDSDMFLGYTWHQMSHQ